MIVVDTQMLSYSTIAGAYTSLAAGVRAKDQDWTAPALWRSEFRNILAGYLRRGEMTFAGALNVFAAAEQLLLADQTSSTSRVIELIQSSPCTAYDLEFVAVAQRLGLTLVTNDQQVLAAFPETAVSPADFVS